MKARKGPRQSQMIPATRRAARSSGVPSAPPPSVEPQGSSEHTRVPERIPSAWLDVLLAVATELPAAGGQREIMQAMVEALAGVLPEHAFGACFAPEPGSGSRERIVVKRLPEGAVEPRGGVDPTRLFPGMSRELVAPLASSTTGSTLHVASDQGDLGIASSPVVHLLDRAAVVLGRALHNERRVASITSLPDGAPSIEERLIQADKLATFGQLAAGVVHELNNPLTSIVAYSDYLIRKALGHGHAADADDVERLRRISDSANRMLRFTRDLVHYARPSGGVAGPVPVHEVVDQAAAFCEHVLAAASMSLERRFDGEVTVVRGVSEQLVQVFVNLLTNAAQAAPASGGKVVVTTTIDPAGRRVRIVVHDNGSGISPEHLAQVFVPFFTTKGDRHGTGLGLSIVKRIVEAHDGEIHVESARGRGTRFSIELPAWARPV